MEDLTWAEAKTKFEESELALIPTGSIEQHGLHAPLKTDSFVAERMSREVSEEMDVICSPTLKIGISSHHKQFWGTLWLKPETFKSCVKDVAESIHYHGIDKIIFVNGHGGNRCSLEEASSELRSNSKMYATAWSWFDSVEEKISEIFNNEAIYHSDAPETSVLWFLDEKSIRKDRLQASSRGGADKWGIFRGGSKINSDVIDFSENGTVGDPENADPEKGKSLYREAKSNLKSLIKWLRKADPEKLKESPHK
ncbi:MAG: creatininase family protein [Candidatus Hadarchaeota archaeon]